MYEKDGIYYAGEPGKYIDVVKIISIHPLPDYKIWVKFKTGEEKIYDCKHLLEFPIFQSLKDINVFNNVYVDDWGIPMWKNGEIDFDPESILINGIDAAIHK